MVLEAAADTTWKGYSLAERDRRWNAVRKKYEPFLPHLPCHELISIGESVHTWCRNGNTRGHPGAVQEADPQPRVRAVESE